MGFHAPAARVEVVADLVEVLLGGAELAGADGAAEDDEGEEEAEEGEGAAAARPLDLAEPASSETPVQHCLSSPTRHEPSFFLSLSLSRRRGSDSSEEEWSENRGKRVR